MKRCIVNFADGAFIGGQHRLARSLTQHGFMGTLLLFQSFKELGCVSHLESLYAFKAAAVRRAVELGFETVLWCDASVWALQPVESVFETIEREGSLFFSNEPHNCAQWTSDACLSMLEMPRDEAEQVPQIDAKCMGFSVQATDVAEFLRLYVWHGEHGTFNGPRNNDARTCSQDPRCRGHRHDQSVASILIHQLGLKINGGDLMVSGVFTCGNPCV